MSEMHEKIAKALEELGAVDYFYCVVTLDDIHSAGFCFGCPDMADNSNMIRYHRLLGAVEDCKFEMIGAVSNAAETEEEEEGDDEVECD